MSRRGMTLLELVVGLTITGLTVTAGVGIVAAVSDRRAGATIAMAVVAQAAAQRDAIVAWLNGARLVAGEGGQDFRGLDGVDGRTPEDEIAFLTTGATPRGLGEAAVRLYVDHDSTTVEQGLVAAFQNRRDTITTRVELQRGVAGMNLRFLTGLLGSRRWTPSWISSTVLPAAIEVTLIPSATDTLPPLLRLPILVPIRGGQ